MEFMKWWTRGGIDIVFLNHTPKQKREALRFIHGMVLFCFALLFIFAPSRSFARYIVLTFYIGSGLLYYFLGDCWVSVVEREYHKKGKSGVLDPVLTLLGYPITSEYQYMVTSVGYILSNFMLLCLMIRDLFGVY
jgi:hypothetical protein